MVPSRVSCGARTRLTAATEKQMRRLIRLFLGVPLTFAAVILGVVAVAGSFASSDTNSRMVAGCLGALSVALYIAGRYAFSSGELYLAATIRWVVSLCLVLAGLGVGAIGVAGLLSDADGVARAGAAALFIPSIAIMVFGLRLQRTKAARHPDVLDSEISRSFRFVEVLDGTVTVLASTSGEAKIAISELRLLKKNLSLKKRTNTQHQQAIRSKYTNYTRNRGSVLRGFGKFGRAIRLGQRLERDSSRAQLANDLWPLEEERQGIDSAIIQIDHLILETESLVLPG